MTSPSISCGNCGKPMARDAAFCASCGTAATPQVALTAEEPGMLGQLRAALADRYAIERELGRGGMATVYLAQDIRHERKVAIKVLLPELAASVGGDRFIREIRVAAKLQHPHILTLFDSGEASGFLYYVMPFVEGESLRDKLHREKMLSVDEAIGLTIEIAEALGYAHQQGIVHRDIKPENIMLANGHALVADFGIARAVSAAETHKLTQTGTAVGTPLYMSPEQAMGEEVGPTADLYSLGCMAFELLTGEPPFTGANARAIMARHTVEAPPGIRTVRDTVPEEVEEAILWCLAKQPPDRPRTAEQFIDALATPLAATATRRSAFRRTMTPSRLSTMALKRQVPVWRRPAVLAAGAVLLLAAISLGAWRWFGAKPPAAGADSKNIAVLYFEDQSPQRDMGYLADGLTEGLIATLGAVPDLHVISRGGADQFRGSTLPVDSIARALRVGTVVRGSVEPEGNDVRVSVRLVDASGSDLRRTSFRTSRANPLAISDTLATEISRMVREALGTEVRLQEQRARTSKPEAWVLFQRAERSFRLMDSVARAGDTVVLAAAWKTADSLAAVAEEIDNRWTDPVILRGNLAYRRSRYEEDPTAAGRWDDVGLGHAERALALNARDPDALELRGTLRYWRWLLELERDPARALALLNDARADLELATQIKPTQAGAWATLAHMYYQLPTSSGLDINNAARKAMESDAYLSNADLTLNRVFLSSYDLGQFPDAQRWCDEGVRRFPASWRFSQCRLFMLTTRADTTRDVRRARALGDSMVERSPASLKAFNRLAANLAVAAVMVRAGQADSARALAGRSLGNSEVDPSRDLALRAAFVYGLLGDTTAAINQLKAYFNANPSKRQSFANDPGWWLRPVENTVAFRQLVGLPAR